MNEFVAMNETKATLPGEVESQVANATFEHGAPNRETVGNQTHEAKSSSLPENTEELDTNEDLEAETEEAGFRNVRHLSQEDAPLAGDFYEAQENVQSSIMAEPETPDHSSSPGSPSQVNEKCNNTTICFEQENSLTESPEAPLSSEPSERRLFGVGTLGEEVRKLRNQKNKLLSRANLKRRKKRKKTNQNEQKNLPKTSQTRQGSSVQTTGTGASSSISNSFRQHFASPLQFPSSVQKMIMSKLNRPQPSASNQHQTRIKPVHSNSGDASLPQDLFFQHSSGNFIDHQQQNSESLNQWIQNEAMPFHAQQNGAKHHHMGSKMIPIEIIGLDPSVTKSILHSNSQMAGTEAQADMSQMYTTSHNLNGAAPTPMNPVYASELALKDAASQAARGLRTGQASIQTAGTGRPITASVLHIHHFHTQAKPGEGSQQQLSTSNGDEQQQQQQELSSIGGNTVAPTQLPPTDNNLSMHFQQQPRPHHTETTKLQVADQPQQVFLNEKGELVYLSSGIDANLKASQDNRSPSSSEVHDSPAEQQSMVGDKQLAQQQVLSDEPQQVHNEVIGTGEQAASSIMQQQKLQHPQHLQQFTVREPGESSTDEATAATNPNRNEPMPRTQSSATKHRVFITTTGQMISVMTPGGSRTDDTPAIGGPMNDKLLMVAYKPQHLHRFKNATNEDSTGVRAPYNEGQESQTTPMSASGKHLTLKNPSLLTKNRQHQQDRPLPDSIVQQLAALQPQSQQGSMMSESISKLPVGAQISAIDQASLTSRGQQSLLDNQKVQTTAETNENNVLKSKPTLIVSDINGKGKSIKTTAGGFPTWFKSSTLDERQPHKSNGYEGSSVFSPTTTFKNNTMNFPTSVLYKHLLKQQSAADSRQLQQIPYVAALTQTKLSPLNGTTTNLSNDLLAGLLNELKLKNGSTLPDYTADQQHLTRANTTFDFNPVNATATSLSQWDHLMPNYGGNLVVRNSSGNNQPRKISSPYDNADKNQRLRLNNLMSVAAQENDNSQEVRAKHQIVGLAPEELELSDGTNGVSNLALAFIIFVISLVTLTIIGASMIYRHRRRSVGRCVDLPPKSRLNLTQRTKRFVFNNFKSTNQEVASIKSINLNITDGTNNLANESSPKSNGGSEGGDGGCKALINGNTVTKNNRTDRISVTQTFGLAPMSTFANTPSSQFTDNTASDIKTIKTRLQKPSYLKSLISTHECPVKLATDHKLQYAQKEKSKSDASCYLDIKHKSPNSSSHLKLQKSSRSPNGDRNRPSHSFSKKISSAHCDVHKQNYNFAFAKPAPSELSFSDRISIDSRLHSDRMSTIHSIDDTSDSKSNMLSTCEAHGPFKRASNISCRATKLSNLMAPKHLMAPQLGHSASSSGLETSRNRNDSSQIDRL